MSSYPKNIRPLREDDLNAVCSLYQKVMRTPGSTPPQGLIDDFRDYFLNPLWLDEEIPSLVYEEDGNVVAFIGSHVRPLRLNGKTYRAAYSGQLVSDPDGRARAAGAFLMKAYMAGPQDITMTDGATGTVATIWKQLGGDVAHVRCLRWTKILRPTRFVSAKLGDKNLSAVSAIMKPFSALIDPLAGKFMSGDYKPSAKAQLREKLTLETYLENVEKIYPAAVLKGDYNKEQLKWLRHKAAHLPSRGRLEESLVRDEKERVIGWYSYYLGKDNIAQVLQVCCKPKSTAIVLDSLFNHAFHNDCVALQGRLEPSLMQSLDDAGCMFRYWGPSTLVYSSNNDLLLAYHQGQDFLTRFDGEWWMAFHREEY